MPTRPSLVWLFMALGIATTDLAASGDTVVFDDDSQVNGRLLGIEHGRILIDTRFAGLLRVDPGQVRSLKVDRFIPGLRSVLPPSAQIQMPLPLGPPEPPLPPAPSAEPAAQAATDPEGEFLEKWRFHFELGLNGRSGNTRRIDLNGRAEANRETDQSRLKLFVNGRFGRANGEDNAQEVIGGSEFEWNLNQRLFSFGELTLENDPFEDIDLRINSSLGLGWFVIKQAEQTLKLEGGLGYEHEFFIDGTDTGTPVGNAALDYRLPVTPWLLFETDVEYVPFLNRLNDYRIVSNTSVEIPLDKKENWRIRLGVRNQFDNEPTGQRQELDTFYFANLVLDLE